jgi:hypothetical protein
MASQMQNRAHQDVQGRSNITQAQGSVGMTSMRPTSNAHTFNPSLTLAARTCDTRGTRYRRDELTRFEQRALIKLFGGGSLRKEDPSVADGLRRRGLVDENNALAMPGLLVLTLAMCRQRAVAELRLGLAA